MVLLWQSPCSPRAYGLKVFNTLPIDSSPYKMHQAAALENKIRKRDPGARVVYAFRVYVR